MKIVIQKGMINIDSESIAYTNIRDLYKLGDGEGLQLSDAVEPKRKEIGRACSIIADTLYQLSDLMTDCNDAPDVGGPK